MALTVNSIAAFSANSASFSITADIAEVISTYDLAEVIRLALVNAATEIKNGTYTAVQQNGESLLAAVCRAPNAAAVAAGVKSLTGPAIFQFASTIDLTSVAATIQACITNSSFLAFCYTNVANSLAGTVGQLVSNGAAITPMLNAASNILLAAAETSPNLATALGVANAYTASISTSAALATSVLRVSKAASISA